MARTAVDTSVLVASLLTWHEHHPVAFQALQAVLASEQTILLPVHTLLETYSVITRLPAPHRLSPQNAFQILYGSFQDCTELVSSTPEPWKLQEASDQGTAGGTVYDAEILASAIHGGADRLLTLNRRDFERLKPVGFEILTPPDLVS